MPNMADIAGDYEATDPEEAGRIVLVRWLLPITLVLGGLGDILLRAFPYGLNMTLWGSAILAAAVGMRYRRDARIVSPWTSVFLATSWLFVVCVAWRDDVYLKVFAMTCWIGCMALASGVVNGFTPARAAFMEYCLVAGSGVLRMLGGGGTVAAVADPRKWRVEALRKPWIRATIRGLLIASPILLVFGLLLMSADRVFSELVVDWFSFDLRFLPRHVFVFALSAWVAGGILVALLFGTNHSEPNRQALRDLQVGGVEAGIVIGAIDALFLVFVVVQFQYFFGGNDRISTVANLTYAEYARHGFFELCAVAALTLMIQYGFHWLIRDRSEFEKAVCRGLSALQLLLVIVIMVSALTRMSLYVDAYGLTRLRFYSTMFMLWIALTLGWFVITVLWGRGSGFVLGVVASGLLMVLSFNAINPNAIIVSWNLSRADAGKSFDTRHALSLGPDAVPALVAGLARLKEDDARSLHVLLKKQYTHLQNADWRSWSWSRHRAWAALDALYQQE